MADLIQKKFLDSTGVSTLWGKIVEEINKETTARVNKIGDLGEKTVKTYVDDAVATEESARKAHIGELGNVSTDGGATAHTVKSFVEAKIAEVNGDASALADRVTANEDAIKVINGDSSKEGSIKKTVADAVAAVVADAPESFDTLKEIAEWIAKDTENENGFDAANRIVALETAVADNDTTVKGLIEAEATRATNAEKGLLDRLDVIEGEGEGSVAKALADAKDYADGLNGDMDSRVSTLETTVGDTNSGLVKDLADETIRAKAAETAVYNAIVALSAEEVLAACIVEAAD